MLYWLPYDNVNRPQDGGNVAVNHELPATPALSLAGVEHRLMMPWAPGFPALVPGMIATGLTTKQQLESFELGVCRTIDGKPRDGFQPLRHYSLQMNRESLGSVIMQIMRSPRTAIDFRATVFELNAERAAQYGGLSTRQRNNIGKRPGLMVLLEGGADAVRIALEATYMQAAARDSGARVVRYIGGWTMDGSLPATGEARGSSVLAAGTKAPRGNWTRRPSGRQASSDDGYQFPVNTEFGRGVF